MFTQSKAAVLALLMSSSYAQDRWEGYTATSKKGWCKSTGGKLVNIKYKGGTEDKCKPLCDADSACLGFHFMPNVKNQCKLLYTDNFNGSGNYDKHKEGENQCYRRTNPVLNAGASWEGYTPTAERGWCKSSNKSSVVSTKYNKGGVEGDCKPLCDEIPQCLGFHFMPNVKNHCRLIFSDNFKGSGRWDKHVEGENQCFRRNTPPVLGNTPTRWAGYHPTTEFGYCKQAGDQKWVKKETNKGGTEDDCAPLCDADPTCRGFHFMPNVKNQCRLIYNDHFKGSGKYDKHDEGENQCYRRDELYATEGTCGEYHHINEKWKGMVIQANNQGKYSFQSNITLDECKEGCMNNAVCTGFDHTKWEHPGDDVKGGCFSYFVPIEPSHHQQEMFVCYTKHKPLDIVE